MFFCYQYKNSLLTLKAFWYIIFLTEGKMDYSILSEKDLYNMLSDREKEIVEIYETYPNASDSLLKSFEITVYNKPTLNNETGFYGFQKMVNKSLKSSIRQAKSKHENLKHRIASLRILENPIVDAINSNNQAFAWYLSKKGYYSPVDPAKIFSTLIANDSDFIKIIPSLNLKKTKQDKLAIFKIMRRMLAKPEEENMILESYYALKETGFCDINQRTDFNWWKFITSERSRKNSHFDESNEHYLLHNVIVKNQKYLPLLLKFKDLDVNIKNISHIKKRYHIFILDVNDYTKTGALLDNPNYKNGNTPIMQLFRWADKIHMLKRILDGSCQDLDLSNAYVADIFNEEKEDDTEKTNEYIDEFVRRGANLDYKNKNGESTVMTAIHHYSVHGLEVCYDLIYPNILIDMDKMHGRSTWAELPPKICEILSGKFPDMKDAIGDRKSVV